MNDNVLRTLERLTCAHNYCEPVCKRDGCFILCVVRPMCCVRCSLRSSFVLSMYKYPQESCQVVEMTIACASPLPPLQAPHPLHLWSNTPDK